MPVRSYRRALPLAAAALAASLLAGAAQADNPAPVDATLTADLDALLADARLANAQAGVEVLDADSGQVLYARQPGALLTPASTLKTFTSTAALDLLGADYRFTTEVRTTGDTYGSLLDGDLVLRGGGDPSLLTQDLDDLAAKVAATGITTVTGRVLADGSRYDSTPYGPGWAWDDQPYSYSPQISGLTLSTDAEYTMGTVQVTVTPGAAGEQAKVAVVPAETPMKFTGGITTGAAGSGSTAAVERRRGANELLLSGSIAAGAAPVTYWETVEDPATLAGKAFEGALARHGVRTLSGVRTATGTEDSQPLVSHDSKTLAELIVPMLKLSNNGMAEQLTKELGKVKGGKGDWATGINQVKGFLKANGLGTPAGRQVDGSGLSRYDLTTPAQMAGLMKVAQTKPWFTAWYNALPVAGNPDRMTGGTLAARMRGTKAENNVHAKSGSMSGVDNLTGFATAPDGRKLVFSVMVSNFAGTSPRPVIDAIAVRLATGPAAPAGSAPAAPAAPRMKSFQAPATSGSLPEGGTRWEDCEVLSHC
ncbi:Putative D-alanyl-D-alanine carboxypeptidase [Kitasatospora sp. MMS16-BH015]|uniref:D-alanyl-D-alanine carboxypeptidase/D-alanyl-D-alanine endopeptidase n=1 Tax=Kitasatospora sp. MMS16-BH015 TaxID=2018025 RepID=UPI000CA2DB86|nr:D-alanyl-D-alanine carboxypeptidase/D-alanyl-D-alanine-endopeptidase [Kitasatospora sp. MMS16-BH015]AUG75441.1 Putative D-alanyl-D-alanine carboxypeptidase [Kitasatospora sp. MMS16-BH015]